MSIVTGKTVPVGYAGMSLRRTVTTVNREHYWNSFIEIQFLKNSGNITFLLVGRPSLLHPSREDQLRAKIIQSLYELKFAIYCCCGMMLICF